MHRLATVYTLQTDATLASLPATHVALCLTSSGICRRLAVIDPLQYLDRPTTVSQPASPSGLRLPYGSVLN